ncbi:IS66 family insertion sequence element accessory protein TnpB [Bradyrhizobium yuanmingense]|uniref:IS66 family insertion sequence element accessory protein TnpB n=1 Tax=Bradyrhizobium yuanmingense TaxID=108015 RepID=UPI0034DF5ABD
MEGLAMFVREHMKANPFSDAVYVFRVKRADRIQLIFRTERVCGLCLFAKRLSDGVFPWPKIEDGVMRLSARNYRRCSKGSMGGVSTRHGRRSSRRKPANCGLRCGQVNQGHRARVRRKYALVLLASDKNALFCRIRRWRRTLGCRRVPV